MPILILVPPLRVLTSVGTLRGGFKPDPNQG